MSRRLRAATESWPLERPFAISRGTKTAADVVVATVDDGEYRGRGESVPYARYAETVEGVLDQVRSMADAVAGGLDRASLGAKLAPGAARNALDCALWDLEAKRAGMRAWQLAGLGAPGPVLTAQTIGLASPEAMGDQARELAHAPLLKIKLDAEQVLERMRAVRAGAPHARLVVDPNEGWDIAMLRALLPSLAALGVEMIEQPLPADDDGALVGLDSPVTLCADESCHTSADVTRLATRYTMVNVKLDKTGGLSEALALAAAAREAGLAVMVGCMVATSLAMAPALLVAQQAAVVDLDGPLLLARDRSPGLHFEGTTVAPPEAELWG